VVRASLAESLRAAFDAVGVNAPSDIEITRPARKEHGDWSTNAALAVAKSAGRNPRDLAGDLAAWLGDRLPTHVASVDVAGPGFVNFHLRDSWLHEVLVTVVHTGEDAYARPDLGRGRTVNVEFVSANPTGPLHAGHGRWAAYGDSLSRILERCGYAVHREFYVNDRGVQMDLFARSLQARRDGREPPEGGYFGEYLAEWAAEMPADANAVDWGYDRVRRNQQDTLRRFGVEFDTWFSERSLVDSGAIEATLAELRERGAAYDADGAVWLRTTDFGDDKDRVLVKSDGDYTYILPDIAYHRDKLARGFEHLIDVWGADHGGYVARLKAGLQALGDAPDVLEVILGQLVTLLRGGEPVRMSKRTGDLLTLDELITEVDSADAIRLTFLLQSIDTTQSVDIEVVRSQAMENPVFYVQMAHARLASIQRVAGERGVERLPLADVDLGVLTHDRELDILRALSELEDAVIAACEDRAPHKVTTWVRGLAGDVHGFYHDCWVLGTGVSPEQTQARLWLVEAARIGLAIGLTLLGVGAPDEM
jgi:arginyl-tRNA synthetase